MLPTYNKTGAFPKIFFDVFYVFLLLLEHKFYFYFFCLYIAKLKNPPFAKPYTHYKVL